MTLALFLGLFCGHLAADPYPWCPPREFGATQRLEWEKRYETIRNARKVLGGFRADDWDPYEERAREVARFWANNAIMRHQWTEAGDRAEAARRVVEFLGDVPPRRWWEEVPCRQGGPHGGPGAPGLATPP